MTYVLWQAVQVARIPRELEINPGHTRAQRNDAAGTCEISVIICQYRHTTPLNHNLEMISFSKKYTKYRKEWILKSFAHLKKIDCSICIDIILEKVVIRSPIQCIQKIAHSLHLCAIPNTHFFLSPAAI